MTVLPLFHRLLSLGFVAINAKTTALHIVEQRIQSIRLNRHYTANPKNNISISTNIQTSEVK